MCVIPLEVNATVVTSKENFDASDGLSGNVILIQNLDAGQLHASQEANISYDLRVGPEYRYLHRRQKYELPEGERFVLRAGQSALVQTEESVHLPKTTTGLILSIVSLAQLGVSNRAAKVDPGYNGPLIVTITNIGNEPVTFARKDRFCCIEFHRVEGQAKPYEKTAKRITSSLDRIDVRATVASAVRAHMTLVVAIQFVINAFLAILLLSRLIS